MKTPLWVPPRERAENANFTRFTDYVNKRYNLKLASYPELHRWSVTENASFWAAILSRSRTDRRVATSTSPIFRAPSSD